MGYKSLINNDEEPLKKLARFRVPILAGDSLLPADLPTLMAAELKGLNYRTEHRIHIHIRELLVEITFQEMSPELTQHLKPVRGLVFWEYLGL